MQLDKTDQRLHSPLTWSGKLKKEGKRLIFTVTTGRSGTGLLAALFAHVPGVAAFHEPEPGFVDLMSRVQDDKKAAARFWLDQKLPFIAGIRSSVYVETSHLFAKGFIEPLLELGIYPDIIILRREPRAVAQSLLRLGAIPGRTELGTRFLLSPDYRNVVSMPQWGALSDYQLCYWYCLEMERRACAYKQLLGVSSRVVETTLQEITSLHGFLRVIAMLGLRRPSLISRYRIKKIQRRRINQKESRIMQGDNVIDFEQEEQEVLRRLDFS